MNDESIKHAAPLPPSPQQVSRQAEVDKANLRFNQFYSHTQSGPTDSHPNVYQHHLATLETVEKFLLHGHIAQALQFVSAELAILRSAPFPCGAKMQSKIDLTGGMNMESVLEGLGASLEKNVAIAVSFGTETVVESVGICPKVDLSEELVAHVHSQRRRRTRAEN